MQFKVEKYHTQVESWIYEGYIKPIQQFSPHFDLDSFYYPVVYCILLLDHMNYMYIKHVFM